MSDDELQTRCTAVLRQMYSAAVSPDCVAAANSNNGGVAAAPIDPRAVDAYFDFLRMHDKPFLQYESAHALVDIVDRLTPEQRQDVQDVAITVLMDLLRSNENDRAKAKAGTLLWEIVTSDSESRRCLVLGPLLGDDPASQRQGAADLRAILSNNPVPTVQQVLQTGIVPRFVEFLQQDEDPDLQAEVAGVVASIAAGGTEEHVQVLVDAQAIPPLVRLLRSPSEIVTGQVAQVMTNYTKTGTVEQVQALVAAGVVPPLCNLLAPIANDVVPRVLSSISNILHAGWVLSERDERSRYGPVANRMALRISSARAGGWSKLLELRGRHPDEAIRKEASELLKVYYAIDESFEWPME